MSEHLPAIAGSIQATYSKPKTWREFICAAADASEYGIVVVQGNHWQRRGERWYLMGGSNLQKSAATSGLDEYEFQLFSRYFPDRPVETRADRKYRGMIGQGPPVGDVAIAGVHYDWGIHDRTLALKKTASTYWWLSDEVPTFAETFRRSCPNWDFDLEKRKAALAKGITPEQAYRLETGQGLEDPPLGVKKFIARADSEAANELRAEGFELLRKEPESVQEWRTLKAQLTAKRAEIKYRYSHNIRIAGGNPSTINWQKLDAELELLPDEYSPEDFEF